MLVRHAPFAILVFAGVVYSAWLFHHQHPGPVRASKISYHQQVKPLLSQYCYGCHGHEKQKGGLSLEAYTDEAQVVKDFQVWEKVVKNLSSHEMPPEKKPQPTAVERELITAWVDVQLAKAYASTRKDPGRVTIRRLNRAEYNNTIRDLLGVNFQPADDFPADDVGYGFDNIGDVLSLPPILLEKYLAAAEKILDTALVTEPPKLPAKKFPAAELSGGELVDKAERVLNPGGEAATESYFINPGEYLLRARAFVDPAGSEPARLALRLDGKEIKVCEVEAKLETAKAYEVRVSIEPGQRRVAVGYLKQGASASGTDKTNQLSKLHLLRLEIAGPIETNLPPLSETHKRIFARQQTPETKTEHAREILGKFASRAYRRAVTLDELDRLLRFVQLAEHEGDSFESGIKLALQAVLVSPHFIFRTELDPHPNDPDATHPINEFELASRLSYFLWSTMPDDELFALAAKGKLRKNLEPQVKRMLKDPKTAGLVDNFAGQWLQIRNLKSVTPDKEMFPGFTEELRGAMQRETELFFAAIVKENRSVLEFLDADYTFLNERLARHYGISGVRGEQFERVSLKGSPRGGLLTQAAILTITSNPTRTSPVKRGKWIMDNILGSPPPPPPPDVPELKEGKELTGTLRQRMEQHRENPSCTSCHARMDAIGFAFENFDGIGAWRTTDGGSPIDPAGTLPSGQSFDGPGGLKGIFKAKNQLFIQCLTEKLLTYALGRGLEYYDKRAVEQIVTAAGKNQYRFYSLILEAVKSVPFQMRRGEGEKPASATQ